jgi:hypothetical protein
MKRNPLSKGQKRDIADIPGMKDSEIDLTDMTDVMY